MMWYNWYNHNPGPYRGPYRRRPRFFPLPFLLLIFFIGPFWHSLGALITFAVIIAAVALFMAATRQSRSNGMLPNQPPPQAFYRPPEPTQYYQPPMARQPLSSQPYSPPQTRYDPYEYGYREQKVQTATKPVSAADIVAAEEQTHSYEGYEQPQVQYPEMLPPME